VFFDRQEISATYTAIAVVSTFVVLHLPRIAASTHEVAAVSINFLSPSPTLR
jgi:hypothetical protein